MSPKFLYVAVVVPVLCRAVLCHAVFAQIPELPARELVPGDVVELHTGEHSYQQAWLF